MSRPFPTPIALPLSLVLTLAWGALAAQDPTPPPAPAPAPTPAPTDGIQPAPPAAAEGATPAAPATPEEWIGRDAPDFALSDADGQEFRLADQSGKTVVLEWTSIVCPFVKRHYQQLQIQPLAKSYTEKGVVWWAIDSSFLPIAHPVKVKQWIEERRIPFPILLDPEGTVGERYSVAVTPTFIVIHDGKIVFYGALDDDVWGKKPQRRQYLVEALDAILAGAPVPEPTPVAYGMAVQYLSKEKARRAAIEAGKREGGAAEGEKPAEDTGGPPEGSGASGG